jgi:hypothetical protein
MSLDLIRIHNQRIVDNLPKERLLVYRLGDGWEPLCKFLGKPVPDEPFPRINDLASLDNTAAKIMSQLIIRWLVILGTAVAVPYLTYRFATGSDLRQLWK